VEVCGGRPDPVLGHAVLDVNEAQRSIRVCRAVHRRAAALSHEARHRGDDLEPAAAAQFTA